MAVNRRWQDQTTKEWQEATSFFDVVCWRDLAENVALCLSKGMRVVVTGRIEQRSWETDDGEHRSKVEIVADEIGPSLRFATADVQRTERRQAIGGVLRVKRRRGAFVLRPASRAGSPARPVARPGAHGTGRQKGNTMTTTHDAPTSHRHADARGLRAASGRPGHAGRQPNNARRPHRDREGLAPSIGALGILHPPLVRQLEDGRLELIAGERRKYSAIKAGLPTIPVFVRDDLPRSTSWPECWSRITTGRD